MNSNELVTIVTIQVQRIKPQALMGKKDCKYAVALDRNGNGLYAKDYVKVIDGPHAVRYFICFFFLIFKNA